MDTPTEAPMSQPMAPPAADSAAVDTAATPADVLDAALHAQVGEPSIEAPTQSETSTDAPAAGGIVATQEAGGCVDPKPSDAANEATGAVAETVDVETADAAVKAVDVQPPAAADLEAADAKDATEQEGKPSLEADALAAEKAVDDELTVTPTEAEDVAGAAAAIEAPVDQPSAEIAEKECAKALPEVDALATSALAFDPAQLLESVCGETVPSKGDDHEILTAATVEISSLYLPPEVVPVRDEPDLTLATSSPQVHMAESKDAPADVTKTSGMEPEVEADLGAPQDSGETSAPTALEKQDDLAGTDMLAESGTPAKATEVVDSVSAGLDEQVVEQALAEGETKVEEANAQGMGDSTELAKEGLEVEAAAVEISVPGEEGASTDGAVAPEEAVTQDHSAQQQGDANSAGASPKEATSTKEASGCEMSPEAQAPPQDEQVPTDVEAAEATAEGEKPVTDTPEQESFAVFPEATPELLSSVLSGASSPGESPSRAAKKEYPTCPVSMLPPPPLPAKERSVSSGQQSAEIIQVDLTSIVDKTPQTMDVTQPAAGLPAASVEDEDDVGLLASGETSKGSNLPPAPRPDGIDSASESEQGDRPAAASLRQQKAQEASRQWQEAASSSSKTASSAKGLAAPSEGTPPPATEPAAEASKPVQESIMPAPRKKDALPAVPAGHVEGAGRVTAPAVLSTPGAPAVCRVQAPNKFPGVQFRKSKKWDDRLSIHAKTGETVTGLVEYGEAGEKWLKISEAGEVKYLPFAIDGLVLLVQEQPGSKAAEATDEHLREQHLREDASHATGSAPEHEYLEESAPTSSNGWNLFCCMATLPPQGSSLSQAGVTRGSQQPPTFFQRLFQTVG